MMSWKKRNVIPTHDEIVRLQTYDGYYYGRIDFKTHNEIHVSSINKSFENCINRLDNYDSEWNINRIETWRN